VKISTLRALFHTQLSSLYEEREIEAIFFIYIDYKYDIKRHHFFLDPDFEIDNEVRSQKSEDGRRESGAGSNLEMLADGCPIQYITGKTTFCNVDLEVNPSVLIPRPETEELVTMILKGEGAKGRRGEGAKGRKHERAKGRKHEGNLTVSKKILDFCTGSGAIAIALAKNIENVEVWATDNAADALETAKKNAALNNVEVHFLHLVILNVETYNCTSLPYNVDIIVSNPPYIPLSERISLHRNVVNYEPGAALFVPDENPLLFYRAIAHIAKKNLREGGTLYFETHENYHIELSAILLENGFHEIELGNDLNGKPRFVSCKKL
jgi:release factor glutamine methyltransferase